MTRTRLAAAALLAAIAIAPAQAAPITFTLGIGVTTSTEYFNGAPDSAGPYAIGSIVTFQFTSDTTAIDRDTGSPNYGEYQDAVRSFRLGSGPWLDAALTGSYKTNSVVVHDAADSNASARATTCQQDCVGQWVSRFSFNIHAQGDQLDSAALAGIAALDLLSAVGRTFTFVESQYSDATTPPVPLGSLLGRYLEGQVLSISAVIDPAEVPEAPSAALVLAGLGALGLARRRTGSAARC